MGIISMKSCLCVFEDIGDMQVSLIAQRCRFCMAGDSSVLWIILPLVICAIIIALAAAVPLLIRRYCRECWLANDGDRCCRSFTFCLKTAEGCTCCGCHCQPVEEDQFPRNRGQLEYSHNSAAPQILLADS
ncbi:unnamed protein product [Soboliphyme baturini]|uniref:Pituitary tumor-transforming gene 1 protein-interacting protein n=1 Tax=Soboliphyme baturini TaxID=241478 RepID=A0A183IYI8_9BILA|nr:unnamed protein product [Soboliphyme baturini]